MPLANRPARALLSSMALVAALPLACADTSAQVANPVLVVGAEGTIPPLDPHRLTGTVGLRITDAIFDPLVRE
jgi:peptide/nickel transport system substrate-binding protein